MCLIILIKAIFRMYTQLVCKIKQKSNKNVTNIYMLNYNKFSFQARYFFNGYGPLFISVLQRFSKIFYFHQRGDKLIKLTAGTTAGEPLV